jgi:NAD(P)-dependent dehydrogenase (short-subunit alcohol dehydrogenase family)
MSTFLISGGGTGIGKGIAITLSKQGHTILLLGRNSEALEQTRIMLTAESYSIVADIRDRTSLARASNQLGSFTIDGIIANAGIGGENHWGIDDRWDDIIETNLTGTYNTIFTFLPFLNKSKAEFKHILVISSVLARLGVAKYSAYCASKAGLLGLVRSLAIDFAPDNILVNAICPGWVETEMSNKGMVEIAKRIGITRSEFFEEAMKDVPLGKMSQPEEVAQLVAYLLSQQSITGQAIDINNGSVMNS